jgi:hypothetical protein
VRHSPTGSERPRLGPGSPSVRCLAADDRLWAIGARNREALSRRARCTALAVARPRSVAVAWGPSNSVFQDHSHPWIKNSSWAAGPSLGRQLGAAGVIVPRPRLRPAGSARSAPGAPRSRRRAKVSSNPPHRLEPKGQAAQSPPANERAALKSQVRFVLSSVVGPYFDPCRAAD